MSLLDELIAKSIQYEEGKAACDLLIERIRLEQAESNGQAIPLPPKRRSPTTYTPEHDQIFRELWDRRVEILSRCPRDKRPMDFFDHFLADTLTKRLGGEYRWEGVRKHRQELGLKVCERKRKRT